MTQSPLFLDSIYDALQAIVRHAGGNKHVGAILWPSKSPEAAGKQLSDCLNPARNDRLDPEELVHLLRIGRESGFDGAMFWIADEVGYTRPEPADPEDQAAVLVQAIQSTSETLRRATEALERLNGRKAAKR